jgi:hypothetical protein
MSTKTSVKKVHISQVHAGSLIAHYGELKTVCDSDIRKCNFMGKSIFGDSYCSGHKPVIVVELRGEAKDFDLSEHLT